MSIKFVILAAGQGTRMQSSLPKVMHAIAGKPMILRILESCQAIADSEFLLIGGYQIEKLKQLVDEEHSVRWFYQDKQLGTAHAVGLASSAIRQEDTIVILAGDVPLIRTETLRRLIDLCNKKSMAIVTQVLEDPRGYGRIKRDQHNNICGIVEHKDASADELEIREINTGIMAIPGSFLLQALPEIDNKNAQQEYYLTDILAIAAKRELSINSLQAEFDFEVKGVNSRQQLAALEREYQLFLCKAYMEKGVSFLDPHRVDFRGSCYFSEDVEIDINVIFEGNNTIGKGCRIGANSILKNTVLGENVCVEPMTIIENAVIDNDVSIGPFARLRPGTQIKQGAKVGNFVEVKKSIIGKGSKVNHLSYIGDAILGEDVNIGAGTITCNYDGVNKYQTIIEDGVFVGSNTSLIAPVTLAENANIGAGSVINKDAPANRLTLARAKQIVIEKWQRPKKRSDKKQGE